MAKERTTGQLKKELLEIREQFAEWKLFQKQRDWVNERINAERKKLEAIVNCLPNGLAIISDNYKILFQNKWLTDKFGNKHHKVCYAVYSNKEAPCSDCVVSKAIATNRIEERELREQDGKYYRVIGTSIGTFDGQKAAIEIRVDVTEQRQAEEKIFQSQKKYVDLVNDLNVGIFSITDPDGSFFEANPTLVSMADVESKDKILKYKVPDFYPDPFKRKLLRNKLIKFGFIRDEEVELFSLKGRKIVASVTAVKKEYKDSRIYFEGVIEDITERKHIEHERDVLNKKLQKSIKVFQQLSFKDSQTGLYNHRHLEEVLSVEFERTTRFGNSLSVIMLDMDNFKSINDVHGHQFGNLILKQLAQQLKKMLRSYDTVFRLGGDEFLIICPNIDRASAKVLAQRILDAINLYNFGNKKNTINLKLSMAVASYPEDRIMKGMDLVNLADQILNKSKEYGGNNIFSSLNLETASHNILEREAKGLDVAALRNKIDRLTRRVNQSIIEEIYAFAKIIKSRELYTNEHIEKSIYYATGIAKTLGLSQDEIELIRHASMIHDVGKVGISENILLKKSKLLPEEVSEVRQHPQIGVSIIKSIQPLHRAISFILYHHERWDGGGYPRGLKGESIPMGARIVGFADAYESLVSDRPYRDAYSQDEVVKIIRDGSGTQFSPDVVSSFFKILH